MDKIKVNDGTDIFYKDWGTGQPLVKRTERTRPCNTHSRVLFTELFHSSGSRAVSGASWFY
jgi:hypothetical protein